MCVQQKVLFFQSYTYMAGAPFMYTPVWKKKQGLFSNNDVRATRVGSQTPKILWDRAIPKVCFCKEIFPIELRDTRKITRLGVPLHVEVVAVSQLE